jgi:hypothetical protein
MGFLKRRRQAREIKREIRFRQGKTRIVRYLNKLRKLRSRYWELGKKALRLGDRKQFLHIARTYLWAMDQSNRWERYLLQLETLEAKRDMVRSTTDFLEAIKSLSASMLAGATPDAVAKMQTELEEALLRGESLDEALSAVMDMSGDALFGSEEISEDKLKELEETMRGEAEREEREGMDKELDERIRKLEEAMRKEV